jgi:hypothetical protein
MTPSISLHFLPKLVATFKAESFRVSKDSSPVVVFPAVHPDVGDVEIHDDGDKLTVVIGNFTHSCGQGHWPNDG